MQQYEDIGHLRHPTAQWNASTALHLAGATQALELMGTYRVGDRPDGALVSTLDIFALGSNGVPVHVFAVGSAAQLTTQFVTAVVNSLRVSP